MSFLQVKEQALTLFNSASFLVHIHNDAEYEQALAFMEELIEEYERYEPLIELLSASIERWENHSSEFTEFNQRVAATDNGVAVLRTLMDQYHLKTDDFKNEIGGKSMVSMILSGSRKLSKDHIQALCDRFKISPALFFNRPN